MLARIAAIAGVPMKRNATAGLFPRRGATKFAASVVATSKMRKTAMRLIERSSLSVVDAGVTMISPISVAVSSLYASVFGEDSAAVLLIANVEKRQNTF